jgi:hypothetical protein
MRVLEELPDRRYGLYAYGDTTGEEFFEQLVSRPLAGTEVRLSSGAVVGHVVEAATPYAIAELAKGAGLPIDDDVETAAIGVVWKSADMLSLARESELVLDPEQGVLLLGSDPPAPKVKKSRSALSDELRAGWGF